jgi:hypothetical protein
MSEQSSRPAIITAVATVIAALITAYAGFLIGRKSEPKRFTGPGISIQYRGDSQRKLVGNIACKLFGEERDIRLLETVNNSPPKTEVRYFRPEDADKAKVILESIQEFTGKESYTVLARGQKADPEHFEIWLGPNLLSKPHNKGE